MKKNIIKMFFLGIVVILTLITLSSPKYAKTEDDTIVLKKSENKYIIYFNQICNNVFQFAISDKSDTSEENLNFVNSAKDNDGVDALNVAYLDETNYSKSNTDTYIWVKDMTDNLIITGEKIDLKNALDDEIINFINTTTIANKETDRIKVDTTQTQVKNTVVDGVDTTIKTGKIVIDENVNSKYCYKLISANNSDSNAGKLYELVDKINNYSGNGYEKLKLAKQFYELYNTLIPEKSEWNNVQNSEILQPEDSITGDKYIVYIKEIKKDGKEIIDIKLLECIREEAQGKNQKEEIIKEDVKQTVKLPVTYDSIILIVILVALIIAMVIVTILRMRVKPKHRGK